MVDHSIFIPTAKPFFLGKPFPLKKYNSINKYTPFKLFQTCTTFAVLLNSKTGNWKNVCNQTGTKARTIDFSSKNARI